MSQKLSQKVAIVTGASKGIGAAIARALAAEGASVVVNYSSSKEGAENVVKDISGVGGKAIAVQANVAKSSDIERLFQETKAAFGKVDIVVNNAGVYEFAPIEEVTPEHYERMFSLNVLGLLLTSREAVKAFETKGGNIINVSSVAATRAVPGGAVYSATKAAVDQITRSLAAELGPRNIRVNSINPGMIETEGTANLGILESDFKKEVESQTPLGRIGKPDEIADVVTFLASEDSRWITGEEILVAGGYR